MLDKHRSSSSTDLLASKPVTTRLTSKTKNPAKLEQLAKVQFMKLRQSAVPGDPKAAAVSVSDRLHVRVRFSGSGADKAFWFRKSISTGKAFDLLCTQLGVPSSPTTTWQLYKSTSEVDALALQYDKGLSDQVADGCQLIIAPLM